MPDDELAEEGMELFRTTCSQCHLVSGAGGNEAFREEDGIEGAALVSGAAPNLTHFASRGVFAGGVFDLWVDQDGNGEVETDEIGERAQRRRPRGVAARPARPRSRWPPGSRAACPTWTSPRSRSMPSSPT